MLQHRLLLPAIWISNTPLSSASSIDIFDLFPRVFLPFSPIFSSRQIAFVTSRSVWRLEPPDLSPANVTNNCNKHLYGRNPLTSTAHGLTVWRHHRPLPSTNTLAAHTLRPILHHEDRHHRYPCCIGVSCRYWNYCLVLLMMMALYGGEFLDLIDCPRRSDR